MWYPVQLYSSEIKLTMRFSDNEPSVWFSVTSLVDGDAASNSIFGLETLLYEDTNILIENIVQQFAGFENVTVEPNFAVMHTKLRRTPTATPGFGFGRTSDVGIDDAGYIAVITLLWNEPGAGTPAVDHQRALSGLNFVPD
jgi:hypothetical protein